MTPTVPKPADIIAARKAAGLTQTRAAELVYATLRAWQRWEFGDRAMPAATWALFTYRVDGGVVPDVSEEPTPSEIRAARKGAGLTQTAAAALAYASPHTWIKWENGQRRMSRGFWAWFLVRIGGG